MSTFTLNSITVQGLGVISRLIAGSTLEFTRIAVGDGALPSDKTPLTVTDLSNRLFDVDISSVQSDGTGSATVTGLFSNEGREMGFFYRELGLFAKDPATGKEILYCYGNAAADAEWISPSGASSVIEKEVKITTLVGNAEKVTANIKSGLYETKEEVARIASLKADLDATAADGGRVLAEQMRFDQEQILYVDAAAADGGDGSEAKPFKTIAAAVAARYLGAPVIYINVKPGTYAEKINIPRSPDTTWRIIRNGTGVVSFQGLKADNAAYLVLDYLTFNAPALSTENCVDVLNCAHSSFSNVTINGNTNLTGCHVSAGRARFFQTIFNNCGVAIAATNGSYISMNGTSGTGNVRGVHTDNSLVLLTEHTIEAQIPTERRNGGTINPPTWQQISDMKTIVTTLQTGIYSIKNGRTAQGLPGNYDGTLIVDQSTGAPHLIYFYDIENRIFHRFYNVSGGGWNDWQEYTPQQATAATYGLLRVASTTDEIDCQCDDAAVTPENLYKLANYRIVSTAYSVGDTVAVPYHADLQLKCTTAGTTSAAALDTANVKAGDTLTDGGVVWLVILADHNPAGTVLAFAGDTIPTGYLACNGAAISRSTYAALFAAIGDTYGSGDGSTTFNLPNLTDKFIQGSATAGTVKSAGLPNIEGTTWTLLGTYKDMPSNYGSKALRLNSQGLQNSTIGEGDGDDHACTLEFNASWSNSIYGNSNTVQPPALTMRYIIKY